MAEERQVVMNRLAGPRPMMPAPVLTPKEVWLILRRHIWLIISLTIVGFLVGGISWALLRMYMPEYTARTYIRVLPPVEKDPMTITSTLVNKDIQYAARLSMANLIKQQSTLRELIDRDKVQQTRWFEQFGKIKDRSITKAFKDLRRHFGVYAERDSDFVLLSMTCRDKNEAALIVNEMVNLFLAMQGGKAQQGVSERLTGLQSERDRVQRELDATEKALDDVRNRWNFADLEDRGDYRNTITIKLDNLELQQNELILMIKQFEADIENLKELATGPINEQIERQIEIDPVMVTLAQQLALLEGQLAGKLTKFGENHRVVRETRELISEIANERQKRKAEIAEQTRQSNLKNAQDNLIVLQERYNELEILRQEAAAKQRDFDLARIQYAQRAAIRDERKGMLDSVKEKVDKLKIMLEDPETPKVQFVGLAPPPLVVSSPLWYVYFPGGTMLGFMCGVGLAFLIELLNDLLRTPRDVGRYLHIPLLGVIPDATEDEQVRDIDLCHVVRQAPYSITSESYRRFRTNLKLSSAMQSSKVLLVSSGMAGDGKTSVAVNLATAFVAEDKKVLLIDANFWRPNLHKIFPKEQIRGQTVEQFDEYGLSTFLMGQCGPEEVIRSSGIEQLDIIDSGKLPSNPAELLGGVKLQELVGRQRENYDYVIIDSPPILLVSGAKVLTKAVDGTVLVFNAQATRRGAAQRTIRELKEVDAVIVGCVLFAVQAMKGGYFQEQIKSYQEYQKLQLAHSV